MKDLGSFIGQMLLRTYDRAQRVYEAMKLRGFNGEYNSTASLKIKLSDYLYLTIWCLFFIVARNFNIPNFNRKFIFRSDRINDSS